MAPLTFLFVGYLATVAIETPVLWFGLHPRHDARTRLFAGLWLTACTYPIVVLALPSITGDWYDLVAETFAPLAEILAFRSVCGLTWRDGLAITAANIASYLLGRAIFG
jgi:hypothetical protein